MVTHTFIDIGIEEAKDLADLVGIEYDLKSAIWLSELLLKQFETSSYDGTLIDAITTAILVRYSRPFVTGARKKLRIEDIDTLNDNEKSKHKWLIEIRNKHIAHSVNTFEENRVIGYYILEHAEKGITGISVQHGRIIGLSSEDAKSVIAISKKVLDHVSKLIEVEKAKVLSIVGQRNIKDLLKQSKQSAFSPDIRRPNKRRKQ